MLAKLRPVIYKLCQRVLIRARQNLLATKKNLQRQLLQQYVHKQRYLSIIKNDNGFKIIRAMSLISEAGFIASLNYAIFALAGLITNMALLVMLVLVRSEKTPFNRTLASLAIANITSGVFFVTTTEGSPSKVSKRPQICVNGIPSL